MMSGSTYASEMLFSSIIKSAVNALKPLSPPSGFNEITNTSRFSLPPERQSAIAHLRDGRLNMMISE